MLLNMGRYRPLAPEQIALFWSHVDQSAGPNGCWPWTKSRLKAGYGRFWRRKATGEQTMALAHVTAYEIRYKPVPTKLSVRHMCHNPVCCNPTHLTLGTHEDNMRDSVEVGRFRKGEASPFAKLTEEAVCEMRKLYKQKSETKPTIRSLAQRFGVSHITAKRVIDGVVWRHVE